MKPTKKPSKLDTFWAYYPFYIKIGWALIIVFGLVGNCAGHSEQSLAIFIITSLGWACTRMIQEGIDAYRILTLSKKLDKEQNDTDKKDGPPPGPFSPA